MEHTWFLSMSPKAASNWCFQWCKTAKIGRHKRNVLKKDYKFTDISKIHNEGSRTPEIVADKNQLHDATALQLGPEINP